MSITSTDSAVELTIKNRNVMMAPQTQTPKTAPGLDQRLGQNLKGIVSYGSVSPGREKWPFNVLFF